MKVSVAFSTKDRVELSKQSIVPLLHKENLHVFWTDGSSDAAAQSLFDQTIPPDWVSKNVRGGADAAIVYNLTNQLHHPHCYDYVGLVENDVLLHQDWFEPTMALFEKGRAEGLEVGAVSARAYEDRILIQRNGYAVMHNLGAGMVIFSRKAAEIVLQHFRTGHTWENRKAFLQTSGLDVAQWSSFCRDSHITCADWQFDRALVQHGLVSLALTPAKCQMIGQDPPLEAQGLRLVTEEVEARRQENAFTTLQVSTRQIREGMWQLPDAKILLQDDGAVYVMPHQLQLLGGSYHGNWKLKWLQGLGPFAWQAGKTEDDKFPQLIVPVSGPASLVVSGGPLGGTIEVKDGASGFQQQIPLQAETEMVNAMSIQIPGGLAWRMVSLRALGEGIMRMIRRAPVCC